MQGLRFEPEHKKKKKFHNNTILPINSDNNKIEAYLTMERLRCKLVVPTYTRSFFLKDYVSKYKLKNG